MADWEDRLVWRDINNNGENDGSDYNSTEWGNGQFNGKTWRVGRKNDMTNVNKYLESRNTKNWTITDRNDPNGLGSPFKFKDVFDLLRFLINNGYDVVKDGYAGLQTMNALKDYIDREQNVEIEGTNRRMQQEILGDDVYADVSKGDAKLTRPVTILPAVKPTEPTLYNGGEALTGKYIKSLGIANYNALRDKALNGNDSFSTILRDWAKERFDWNNPADQAKIEKALNISGRYRGSRVGDYGDMARVLNEFIGTRNGELSKNFPKKESPESIIQEFQAKGPHMSLDNYNAMLQKLTDAGYKNFVPGTTSNSNTLLYNDKPFENPYLDYLYKKSRFMNMKPTTFLPETSTFNWKDNTTWGSANSNTSNTTETENTLLGSDLTKQKVNTSKNKSSVSNNFKRRASNVVKNILVQDIPNRFSANNYKFGFNAGKTFFKTGGKMTQKYQTGGAAPQGDPQEQIIQLVQAAMSGDQQASAQIQLIMQAAQQGDQQAAQLAEMIMQIANQMQGGAPQSARNGAKLNYIKRLKGECPEGYEMTYFKAGGKVCKKCQKKVEKACGGKQLAKCGTKFHKAGGVMESILSEMFAKGGAMNRNKHTAFGEEKGANVVSTNHAGRWGGRRAFNANGTHQLNKHDKPNKFTAFGDEGKKKPTNVGLVGHHATGKTGRMQNRQKAGVTYKATAFGGEKQKRFHRGAKASSIGRIGSISGYPKGHGGKSGIGRI